MKLYMKMCLALAIAFVFLTTSKLLTSKAVSAGANQQPKIAAESRGVMADASIHRTPPPDNGIEKAALDVGKINVNFPPGGSASSQFNNSQLPLLGTPIVTSGPGSGTTSITQTGPQAFRVQSNYAVGEVYYSGGAVTFDSVEARQVCDVASGVMTCSVMDVVFKNLKVNGETLPDRPAPNTRREFIRQVTVGGSTFPAKYVVILSPSSVMTDGEKTLAKLAGIDAVARSLNSADGSGSQEAMLFTPFSNGIKNGGPNIEWVPSHLILPGSKIKHSQIDFYTDEVLCAPSEINLQK
jgi:hypothetical protein